MAAAGTAAALYYFFSKATAADDSGRFASATFAPRTFFEDLYFFAEGLRYLHDQTLGRWRTVDLLFGISYLCSKDAPEHPVADIAHKGRVFAYGLSGKELSVAMRHLDDIERICRYCSGLRERRPVYQRRYLTEVLGIPQGDILRQQLRAGVLKPSFVLTRDSSLKAIVLAIRGTHSFKDAFTSLTGAAKPHHMIDGNGVVLGYSHFGMLAAARWLKGEVSREIQEAMEANPDYRLLIVGHSLGGGTAAMLTMMLRESGGVFADANCIAIACPACMTLDLAKSCSGYVTTIINSADVIPTICPATADSLREEVMNSSWFADLRDDVRASRIVRMVERSLCRVGSATATATSWTTSRLNACYPRVRHSTLSLAKRRKSEARLIDGKKDKIEDDALENPSSGGKCIDNPGYAGGYSLSKSLTTFTSTMKQLTSFSGLKELHYSNLSLRSRAPDDASLQDDTSGTSNVSSERDFDSILGGEDRGDSSITSMPWTNFPANQEASFVAENRFGGEEMVALDECEEEELEAQVTMRIRAVEQAVKLAEAEEANTDEMQTGAEHVPAIIHPGQYGGVGWKRHMYPAGRILHLVPAYLVQDVDLDSVFCDNGDETIEVNGYKGLESQGDARVHLEGDPFLEVDFVDANQFSPYMRTKNASTAAKRDGLGRNCHHHSREISELSTTFVVSCEEAVGSASGKKISGEEGPLPALKPPRGHAEPMILMDNIPQEAYGRIKL